MLVTRSCLLPAALHRAGSSSSWATAPAVQRLHRTPAASHRLLLSPVPEWVCWAGPSSRYGSGSSSSSDSSSSSSSSSSSRHRDTGVSGQKRHKQQQQQQQQGDGYLQVRSREKPGQPSSSNSSGKLAGNSSGKYDGNSSTQHKPYKPYSKSGGSSSSSSTSSPSAPRSSPLPRNPVELLVIGAGAAGLTAAYFAARSGAEVTVLERTRESGKKILMSGGSRCNVLPLEVDLQMDYVTGSSSSAMRAVFSTWTLEQCLEWLAIDIGLDLLLEEETNKWFPASDSSREVRDRLVAACENLGVKFVYNASVEGLAPPAAAAAAAVNDDDQASTAASSSSSSSEIWQVDLADGSKVSARQVIMSTGGRSFPAVGTDGTGLNLLSKLGHKLTPQYAALTPLKGAHPGGQQLAGLTLSDVRLSVIKPNGKVGAVAQRGGLLFTHKGYSGPAILDLSHWLVREMEQQQQQQSGTAAAAAAAAAMPKLVVNWTNESPETWQQRLAAANGAATVENFLRKCGIKERLANALCLELGISGKPMSHLKKTDRHGLLIALTAWQLPVMSHEGYKKAEVTGGGVALEQIDCRTMQSRILPGLYLCGEVLDVFGRIGGFNFYWAWLTGRAAGLAAATAAVAAAKEGTTAAPASRVV